jgi:hypothetical protein
MIRYFYPLIFIPLLFIPSCVYGGIIFFDDIAIKGQALMLRAETRGRFFTEGGRMVEFYVDGRSIGRNLSGGDGVAMKEFIPKRRGLYKITVESDGDRDSGHILSLNMGEGVVLIDIEGGIFEGPLSMRPRRDSKEVIEDISKRFPVIYLKTGLMDRELLEDWLEEKGFQALPILEWEDGGVVDMIYEKGLKVIAIVGSATLMDSIEREDIRRYSFEDTDNAQWVKDWKEIEKGLKGD